MAKHESTYEFSQKASHPKNAVGLIYDLEGFSQFFGQPDVQDYVPVFLNVVSQAMKVVLFGGDGYWLTKERNLKPLSFQVAHEKFLGDGALYVLTPSSGSAHLSASTLQALCNRLWNLKNSFSAVVDRATDQVPVVEVPKRIRFGLARGTVFELKKTGTRNNEYIGFCINLASRLQSYCPDLGFIASARLTIPNETIVKHGYKKVVATKLRGFQNEIVVVDRAEYSALSEETRDELFEEL